MPSKPPGKSGTQPPAATKLSALASKYDIGHKGYLTAAEQKLCDMDVEGTGHVSNATAVKVMEHTVHLQHANKSLKRWIAILLTVIIIVGGGMVYASFLASKLAKDTAVQSSSGLLTVENDASKAVITVSQGNIDSYAVVPQSDGRSGACVTIADLNRLYDQMATGTPTNLLLEQTPTARQLAGQVNVVGLKASGSESNSDGVCFGTTADTRTGQQLCYDFGDFCEQDAIGVEDDSNIPGDVFNGGDDGTRRRRKLIFREHWTKENHANLFRESVKKLQRTVQAEQHAKSKKQGPSQEQQQSPSSQRRLEMATVSETGELVVTTSSSSSSSWRRWLAASNGPPTEELDFELKCHTNVPDDQPLHIFGYSLDTHISQGEGFTFFNISDNRPHYFSAAVPQRESLDLSISGNCFSSDQEPVCDWGVRNRNGKFFVPLLPGVRFNCNEFPPLRSFKYDGKVIITTTITEEEKSLNSARILLEQRATALRAGLQAGLQGGLTPGGGGGGGARQ